MRRKFWSNGTSLQKTVVSTRFDVEIKEDTARNVLIYFLAEFLQGCEGFKNTYAARIQQLSLRTRKSYLNFFVSNGIVNL